MTSRSLVGIVSTMVLTIVMLSPALSRSEVPFEITELEEDRPRCDLFDPMRQAFFGTTHLHTGLSFDASIRFVDIAQGNDPHGAYQFAQGKSSITLPNIIGGQGVMGCPSR